MTAVLRHCFTALLIIFISLQTAAAGKNIPAEINGLNGTLTLPENSTPKGVILFIAGSGPVDRDGNSPGSQTGNLRMLGDALSDAGYITLWTDKAGTGAGATTVNPADITFAGYLRDYQAWFGFLQKRYPDTPVYLLGHSEGALFATLMAQQHKPAGIILVSPAGYTIDIILKKQMRAQPFPPEALAYINDVIDRLKAEKTTENVPPSLNILFAPELQRYFMVWMQYDPAEELAKVTVPGLIIQGGHDCQIPPENGEQLIRTAPDNQYAEIATMNHVLKATPADCAAAISSYNNPVLPLHPELVPAITRFLSAR